MIQCLVQWERGDANFIDRRYSRRHQWTFDGGATVSASSSPSIVPVPMSDESAIDPEEAFVAALSSCHMLWFLSIAAKRGYVVDSYRDESSAVMSRNERGKLAVSSVILRPSVVWGDPTVPSDDEVTRMHEVAHEECFLANSVTTEIRVELPL